MRSGPLRWASNGTSEVRNFLDCLFATKDSEKAVERIEWDTDWLTVKVTEKSKQYLPFHGDRARRFSST